jgi:hypothetical protein
MAAVMLQDIVRSPRKLEGWRIKFGNLSGIAVAPLSELLDEFKCHPNHMNHLRQQYINIFAELAESHILSDILSQIHGCKGSFPKLSTDLAEKIRGSNYALS